MNNEIEKYQIGFSDEFSYNDVSMRYEVSENDNMLHLYIEDCAKALGVVDTKKLKDGSNSTTVRWNRVYEDLVGIERIANSGDFKSLTSEDKKQIRKDMREMTITESQLYLWSFRVDSSQGKKFREWLANVVLPNLREHGIYINGMEDMNAEQVKLETDKRIERYILRKFGIGIRKDLTDIIKKALNPPNTKEGGYIYAEYTNLIYNVIFDMDCKEYKGELGLTEKDNLRDFLPAAEVNLIAKAEDFLCNLLGSGITNTNTLNGILKNWYTTNSI